MTGRVPILTSQRLWASAYSTMIKECPWCGSKLDRYSVIEERMRFMDQVLSDVRQFLVYCHHCEATGPKAETMDGAIEKWNTRTSWREDE